MAARYCKVCKRSLSPGDIRMGRKTHYSCTVPLVLPISEFCSCKYPSLNVTLGSNTDICITCGKEIKE